MPFRQIKRWENNATAEVHWLSIAKKNVGAYYGLTPESRQADPKMHNRYLNGCFVKRPKVEL